MNRDDSTKNDRHECTKPSSIEPALAKWLVASLMLVNTSVASFAAQSGELVSGKTYAESKPGTAPTLPVAKRAPI